MKGGGVSQKHTAVGQRSNQIAFKAVCFSDRSGTRGKCAGGGDSVRKIVHDAFLFYHFVPIMSKGTGFFIFFSLNKLTVFETLDCLHNREKKRHKKLSDQHYE